MKNQRSEKQSWLREQIMRLGFSPWTLIAIFGSIAILFILAFAINFDNRDSQDDISKDTQVTAIIGTLDATGA